MRSPVRKHLKVELCVRLRDIQDKETFRIPEWVLLPAEEDIEKAEQIETCYTEQIP